MQTSLSMLLKARFIFILMSALCFSLASSAPSPPKSLRDAAQHAGIFIGAAARPALLSEPAYAIALAREFNML